MIRKTDPLLTPPQGARVAHVTVEQASALLDLLDALTAAIDAMVRRYSDDTPALDRRRRRDHELTAHHQETPF